MMVMSSGFAHYHHSKFTRLLVSFSNLGDKFGWLLVFFSISGENSFGCLYLFQFPRVQLDRINILGQEPVQPPFRLGRRRMVNQPDSNLLREK